MIPFCFGCNAAEMSRAQPVLPDRFPYLTMAVSRFNQCKQPGHALRGPRQAGRGGEDVHAALQDHEEALGPNHTSTLSTVNNLGLLYADQGKNQIDINANELFEAIRSTLQWNQICCYSASYFWLALEFEDLKKVLFRRLGCLLQFILFCC